MLVIQPVGLFYRLLFQAFQIVFTFLRKLSATHSKNRDLHRGINEFEKGYQPSTNPIKNENGDLLADPHKILNRWKNFS
jgi:hypothetical protein